MKPLEISYINRALFVLALSALLTPASTHAASAFYQHFIEVQNTKKGFLWDSDLVQTNNPGPDLTNAPIPYARFAEGEIAEVRLGMTMQEVIDHWGKPCELVTYCGIGPRFWYGRESDWYGNISLSFVGDRLVALAVTGSVAEQLRFDNGLSGKMGKADYQRVLGTPLAGRKGDEARHVFWECLLPFWRGSDGSILYARSAQDTHPLS